MPSWLLSVFCSPLVSLCTARIASLLHFRFLPDGLRYTPMLHLLRFHFPHHCLRSLLMLSPASFALVNAWAASPRYSLLRCMDCNSSWCFSCYSPFPAAWHAAHLLAPFAFFSFPIASLAPHSQASLTALVFFCDMNCRSFKCVARPFLFLAMWLVAHHDGSRIAFLFFAAWPIVILMRRGLLFWSLPHGWQVVLLVAAKHQEDF